MQSNRVIATISMIGGDAATLAPMRQPNAPRHSVSDEALETLPILRFSRTNSMPFLAPSGNQRGLRKHVSPAGVCASVRNASHIGAETKNLWPVIS